MNVVKEGVAQYFSFNFTVDLGTKYKEAEVLNWYFKASELGIVSDIMDLVLNNLDKLVDLPQYYGEENMSSLLLNYLVMKYLQNLRSLTLTVKARLRRNVRIAYQKVLDYHQMDGSFSSFLSTRAKENSRNGSTFLTSYVLRFLPQIKEFINFNQTIIEEGLAYLSKQQADDGSFIEKGDYVYDSQRNPLTLTGAAVLAFLENPAYAGRYFQNIIKGLEFIGNNLQKYKLLHIRALATYASNMAKHEGFKKKSLMRWISQTSLNNQSQWWHNVYLSNIEFTSNNLFMLLHLNSTEIHHIERVVKRHTAWRKSLGFASTQRTVVGLVNLINVADVAHSQPAEMEINFISDDKNYSLNLTKENGFLYNSLEFPPKTHISKAVMKGKGLALFEVTAQYDLLEDQTSLRPNLIMKLTRFENNNRSSYLLAVCVRYVGEEEYSNMTLLEISTATGYIIDDQSLKEMRKLKTVGDAHLQKSGTLLVVYFDHLYKNSETCLAVEALRTHAVAMQKPATIQLYDYFDEGRRTIFFYGVESKLCDICVTQKECSKCK